MKTKFILSSLVAPLMLALPAPAQESNQLGIQMETMNDAYKLMRREKDPEKGAALAREAQDAMVKAITETPEQVEAMPEGTDKAKAAAEYRKMMGGLIATLAEMELAFLENDLDKVQEIVQHMRAVKKEGHDKFMEE